MNIFSLTILSFGMSMDAFAAAIAKGAEHKPKGLSQALKAGLFFGVVEAIMPIIGYWLGVAAGGWLSKLDHWVAFILLLILGIKFIYEAVRQDEDLEQTAVNTSVSRYRYVTLLLTAVATSIDSMVVGVSLAFLNVNIYLASLLIGLATTIMATLGLYLGHRLGVQFGKVAMFVGGISLIAIGGFILYDHLVA